MANTIEISDMQLRGLAVEALADVRTVKKVIAGKKVRGDVDRRIREVLRKHAIHFPEVTNGDRAA